MLIGTQYGYGYNHKRKEVIIKLQIGAMPPVEIVMGAEAFCQDIDFISKDKRLAHFLGKVREMKDLPVDYDFGEGGGEIKFDPKDWDSKMGGGP